jgi:hypothetical protein
MVESAATKDYLNVGKMEALQAVLANEPVLFSTLVQQKTFMFFTKSKLVIITDKRILVANSSKKVVRF